MPLGLFNHNNNSSSLKEPTLCCLKSVSRFLKNISRFYKSVSSFGRSFIISFFPFFLHNLQIFVFQSTYLQSLASLLIFAIVPSLYNIQLYPRLFVYVFQRNVLIGFVFFFCSPSCLFTIL